MSRSRRTATRGWSVRTRVVSLMLALMAAAFVVAGALLYLLQFRQLAERVDGELNQEVSELRTLAVGDPAADRDPYDELDELFFDHLNSDVAGTYEEMLALIDGAVVLRSGGEQAIGLNRREVLDVVSASRQPGRAVIVEAVARERDIRMVVVAVDLAGDPREGTLVVGIDIESQRAQIHGQIRSYALLALGALVFTGLAGWFVSGRLLRPLSRLREAAATISTDDLTQRVDVDATATDVAELALRFNTMLDRLEAGVADQRRFLNDAAHELRTPLTVVQGHVELIDPNDPRDVAQTCELVLDETERMQRLVEDMLLLAKRERPDFVRPADVEVAELAEEAMDRVRLLGDRRWVLGGVPRGRARLDRHRVLQAVEQLCANAVQFSEPGSAVTVTFDWTGRDGPAAAPRRQALTISVCDEGVGVADEDRERIFERFGRGSNAEHVDGSGLGLAIVSAIAVAHGGTATVGAGCGRGSIFSIVLPQHGIADEPAARSRGPAVAAE